MSNYILHSISNDKVREAKEKAKNRVEQCRRTSEAQRIVAERFDGTYITKRIEEKILEAVPGAKRVYLSQDRYSDNVHVYISYAASYCAEKQDAFFLCKKNERRLNGSQLIEAAKRNELEAMRWENLLGRIDGLVEQYNAIARQYAAIENDLNNIFNYDLPSSDYTYERESERENTPEKFLESVSE